MNTIWKYILKLFILTRVITLIAAIAGYYLLDFKWSFPYWDTVLVSYGHPLFWSWANFDGVHYLMLAGEGYNFGLTQAFFPLYMLLIRWFSFIILNKLLVALIISHACYLYGLYMFYKLLRLDFNKATTRRILMLYALFPTSFYFFSVYTESLFTLLLFSIFYLMRTNRWFYAGLIGIALTASRIVGIFIIPALLYESLHFESMKASSIHIANHLKSVGKKHYRLILYSLIPALGLISYMTYLYIRFDDPFLFAHVQKEFGAGRETDKLVLLYQVIWRYLKMIVTVDRSNPLYFTIWLEFIAAISSISLLVWGFFHKLRPSYLIFSLAAIILPTLTGNFSSMPRYVLVAFPVFIILGQTKSKWINLLYIPISIALLIITTAMFTRGYWIS